MNEPNRNAKPEPPREEALSAPHARATIKLELTDMPDEALGQTLGRYKLLEKVGEGGCGVVYVAEQIEPIRRRVALKIIKLGMDTKAVVARFEAERQALAMMDHPNIAKVFDAGTTESGRPYFVMELVRGVHLTEYCDQANLSANERIDLFLKVCQAIQHAHQKGIIHRDIKPSNVLVTLRDNVPVPKVIDFGIAKATEGRLTDATVYTQLHQFIGTPAYMSPEQAEMSGLDIDTRSDIYSLGVLLYELLAGSTPFDAKELMAAGIDAMRKTIREQEPMRPSTRLATLKDQDLTTTAKRRSCDAPKLIHLLRGDLDWVIMKCLEKDRVRRYETANGLAADLTRYLQNEPVVARPPSNGYRFQKMVRRNKLLFATGSAVSLAVIAGLGFSSWSFLRERKAHAAELTQHRIADEERHRAEARETEARRLLYVADMNLAQNAWEQNHLGRLRELLADTRSSPDRGFEWYYWQGQSHQALTTLRGHQDRVSSVAFSPDGRRIVTGSYDHTAKIWEASSGRELLTLKGHGYWIDSVAFSPDGQWIVTGSNDRTAKVWEANSGREQLTLKGHTSAVTSVAFSSDGRRIVTGSGDHTAKVWEVSSGRELLTLTGHRDTITCVAFSPDGQRMVTGDYGGAAKVWDASSGRVLLTFAGHTSGITSVAFSPDGRRIATGSYDQTAKVWEPTNGKEELTFKGHNDMVLSVAFSPDGQWVLTGSNDKTAKVWEAASGRELLTLKGHLRAIWGVAISPDGQRMVTGSDDGTAKVWEPTANRQLLSLKGHTKAITSVAVSPDGRRILTGSDDA
ncbi:MAG TPA: protein kinase, partial [Verrucomicrobiae bacterium]|nr:protein kinase [Verrucomicrobiae bacterium]